VQDIGKSLAAHRKRAPELDKHGSGFLAGENARAAGFITSPITRKPRVMGLSDICLVSLTIAREGENPHPLRKKPRKGWAPGFLTSLLP